MRPPCADQKRNDLMGRAPQLGLPFRAFPGPAVLASAFDLLSVAIGNSVWMQYMRSSTCQVRVFVGGGFADPPEGIGLNLSEAPAQK